jgi:hypothetical protein
MAVVGSPFCEHKKLRTSCAVCKATAVPPPAPEVATKYVATHEREAPAARRPAPAAPKPGGPAKPLMPKRAKQNMRVTREEAEHAQAWWVRK